MSVRVLLKMLNVLTVEETQKVIKDNFKLKLDIEQVGLFDALNRQLAEDIYAKEPVPAFTRSTMDGFAVNSADTFGASPGQPAYLQVIGDIKMGEVPNGSINPDEAFKIATGGALPKESDAVVMLEDTEWFDENTIAVLKPVAPGENVIFAGEDVKKGSKVLEKGAFIRPQDLGILAGIGMTKIPVYRKVNVGIISTGNEIMPPDEEKLISGKIRDINSYTLYGMIKQIHANAKFYGIIPDDFTLLKEAVIKALSENDIVLLSGGSSVGTKDLTAKVFEDLPGFRLLFHGISIKPGKPTLAAINENKLLVGLPGHPVSAMVVFDVVISPIINENIVRPKCLAKMKMNVASAPGRQDYVRVKLKAEENGLMAEPVLGKSGLISTMVDSDGYVVIPLSKEGITAGEIVEVYRYRGGD